VAIGALVLAGLLLVGPAQGAPDTSGPIIEPHYSIPPTNVIGGNVLVFAADVSVGFTYSDPQSGIKSSSGCDTVFIDQETARRDITCLAINGANIPGSYSVTVMLDETAPTVTLSAARSADQNGWYNHPVDFAVDSFDALSGVESCGTVSPYAGPDRSNATVTVSCRDFAGNVGTDAVQIDYDDTAPSVKAVPARRPDRYGWYSRAVRIGFAGQDAVSHVAGCSSKMYGHPNSAKAAVTGWCEDRAGNRATKTFRFRFSNPLLEPRKGMRVSSPPLLDWVSVPRARGYNVQLWHDGRKILSRWPTSSRLRLDRSWRYQGSTSRLARGESYTWYVWPRFKRGYGKMLGTSRFAFVRTSSRSIPGVS
jgi:hypothetical protein